MHLLIHLLRSRFVKYLFICLCIGSGMFVLIQIAEVWQGGHNSQNDKIGHLNLPRMTGWEKQVHYSTSSQRIKYKREISGARLFLFLDYSATEDKYGQPYMSQENKKMIVKGLKAHVQSLSPGGVLSSPGQKSTLISIEEKNDFRYGLVLTFVTKTVSPKVTEEHRMRSFFYRGKFYQMSSIVVGKVISPEIRHVTEIGWQTLWNGMTPDVS